MTKKKKTNSSTTNRVTAYAKSVISGKTIAGPHVRNTARRHIDDLKRKDIYFDLDVANRAIRFFEKKLVLSEGQFENTPFNLHPSQAFIIGSLFGWKKLDGFRRFRRAYIEQGKGNGKSPLAGGIGLFGLMADGEAGAQIYSAGATKAQAGILFADAVSMARKAPDLNRRLKYSGGVGNEYNIAYQRNGSFFRPVSRESKKTGSGPRPHFALVDELHEHADGGVIQILERGFKFRQQPLVLIITNSGSDRTSVCWEEHEHAIKVAAGSHDAKHEDAPYIGEIIDDTTFSFVCSLDEGDDPLEDRSCWIKANPLLGVTLTEEYLAGVVEEARALPSRLNNILRLHFCVWTDAPTVWMARKTVEPCIAEFDPLEHKKKKLWLAVDLSQTRDLTALGAIVETGVMKTGRFSGKPTYDAWAEAFTPKDTLASRVLSDKAPYDVWVREGHLEAVPGESIDYLHIAQRVAELNQDYDIQFFGYDRYAFRAFEKQCLDLGLDILFVEHPQGGTKKGKPTEEMKAAAERDEREVEGLWFPASVRLIENLIFEKRIRIRQNPVTIAAIMGAATESDRWENRWLSKIKSNKKIDPIVALTMAVGTSALGEAEASGGSYLDDSEVVIL